jgi:zinc transport system substrate-binding protein
MLVPLTIGCESPGGTDSDKLQIAAGFYPFAYVAERVAGEHATVTNLTTPGVEPHDLELTPRQVAEISDADLAIYEAGFQPSLDDAIEQNPPHRTLEVTEVVSLHGARTSDASLEGDPHLWQDPTLLIPVAEQLADDLMSADPDHAADFKANAAEFVMDLQELDQDFEAGLADCERREIVTSHAAFGYLANRYDLTMIPIAGLSPDVEPSPERLAEIQDLVEKHNITTIFSETLGSKEYAETLADDLGVTAAVLDPVEGLADDGSDEEGYLSLMRANLSVLQEANNCT